MNDETERDGSLTASRHSLQAVVAIPVCNEGQRIAACLQSLVDQTGLPRDNFGVLLFCNNCTDDTVAVIEAQRVALPWRLRVVEVVNASASAGWARRQAMEAASDWLEESGAPDAVLLTTDADSRVGPLWVSDALTAIAVGADAVAGRIVLDADEAALLPASLHSRGELEARYEALLIEIGARLDPEPGDAWPCHWTRSGASLAVRRRAYEAVGGMPSLPVGEDRAFVEKLRSAGFIVRHAPEIVVTTSGRLEGRAAGGAADTMRRRCVEPDSLCDDRLERLDHALHRVLWRRWLRRAHAAGRLRSGSPWSAILRVRHEFVDAAAMLRGFGGLHAAIEAASPLLAYRPLPPSRLATQIRLAELLVRVLRRASRAGRPIGSAPFSTALEPARTGPLPR